MQAFRAFWKAASADDDQPSIEADVPTTTFILNQKHGHFFCAKRNS
jgi:hypothetical protein